MKKFLFTALVLACVPLAGCNQQANRPHHNKGVHDTERGNATNETERGTTTNETGGGRGRGLRRACGSEIQQYCANEERGRARRECLQNHMDQLSADCKSAVESRGKGRRRRDF
jgi:outer membrane murein-binding lipoprotein Lpp